MTNLFITISLVVFSAFTMLLALILMKRNNWVLKKRVEFIHTCSDNITRFIDEKRNDIIPVSQVIDECLWSYKKCVFHLWIWDLEKMVKDKKLYNRYYKGEW